MTVRLKKRRLYTPLWLGLLWILFGILYFVFDDGNTYWLAFGYLLVGGFELGQFFYSLKHQYITIKNGIIRKNMIYGFKNKVILEEIDEIKKISGYIVLRSKARDLFIDPLVIENESLQEFTEFLKQTDLPAKKKYTHTLNSIIKRKI